MTESNDEHQEHPADLSVVLEKLAKLEKRIDEIERRQVSAPPPLPDKVLTLRRLVDAEKLADSKPTTAFEVPPITPPPTPPIFVKPNPVAATDVLLTSGEDGPKVTPPDAIAAVKVVPYEPKKPEKPKITQGSIEQTIGLKWAGWVGAVVLVIGAGLGIKFAYDQGWLGGLPATAKWVILWLVGVALIGLGEYVYRKVNKLSAAGLYGSGVALLFLVSYAGHGYFDVYARDTAFLLMGVSTLVGSAVAMRGRLVSIGVLSLIGGHVAPIILGGDTETVTPFLSYLTGLQVVALVLAWWGGTRAWWTLRTLSLVANTLWVVFILSQRDRFKIDQSTTILLFSLIYAGLFQIELILSALKRAARATVARSDDQAAVVFSLFVTGLLTVAALVVHHNSTDTLRGQWVVGLAIAHGVLGFVLTRASARAIMDGMRRIDHPVYRLALGYRVQATVLLIVAVPVALTGISVLFGWALMSLALAMIGAKLDLPIARRGAAVTWLLAVGYLLLWTRGEVHNSERADVIGATLLGLPFPQYWFSATGLLLLGHVVSQLLVTGMRDGNPTKRVDEMRRSSLVLNAIAAAVFVVASIAALPPLGATALIAVYAWLLLGADFALPRRGLVQQAAVLVVLGIVKWVVVDCLADRLSPQWSAASQLAIVNPMMGVGLLLSITLVGIGWLRRDVLLKFGSDDEGERSRGSLIRLATAVIVIITIGLSFEIDRQFESPSNALYASHTWHLKHLAWTILWSVSFAAVLGLEKWLRPESVRAMTRSRGLALIALILAAKYLLIDTLAYRLMDGPATLSMVTHFQRLGAVVIIGLLVLVRILTRRPDGQPSGISGVAGFGAMFVTLWIVSFQIDTLAETQTLAAPWVFRQVGWSVCWSIFAVLCVIIGFSFRLAPLRYFGLGLFGATLLKVVLIDLSSASTGYRILSFLGLGALLLGTSVLYGKVSPILLAQKTGDGQA